ncbi:MAG: hypothetical protein PHR15_06070 [Atopobiaceae bacterium]|jgi:hypothetical protein|nr:hypothetical protein [Atopobiaceae bacterium]MCH4180728.1 hypothetical protein [Atopobiaceae bacterium]MCH4215052.1 hypothetical protein [Atopobiaceae bacterium]MCH4230675.1 hypothetical protein [Atopobiaceae bacterium]MCH4277222.1 hypothetical protein [Atopobiaceae bacterium]
MYHEVTKETISRRRRGAILSVLAVVLIVAICGFAYRAARDTAREQGAASLRNAILTTAQQCCAVEGSYPTSLSYLEGAYGLQVNTTDYIVTYECYAANVTPSIVVVPR